MEWSDSVEGLLSRYCDEAASREAMHRLCFYKKSSLLNFFRIPIICFSALSGSIQFLSKSFPDVEKHIITGTASLSIITSLLSAVMSYCKLAESMTKNEQALIEWQGFYNHIKHQLSLSRVEREAPDKFMEWVKTKYERLFELSPVISQKFINKTKQKIKKYGDPLFISPNYLNGLSHTHAYQVEFEDNTDDEKSI